MKLSILKKALISGVLAISALASSLLAATPVAAAGTASMYLDPTTQNVGNGATDIVVTLKADSQTATRSWGAEVNFEKTKVQYVSSTYGAAYYTSDYWVDQLYSLNVGTAANINTAGKITMTQACIGGTGGPTGIGTLITLHFRAIMDNTVANFTFNTDPAKTGMGDVNSLAVTVNTTNDKVIIGAPTYPDLVPSISFSPAIGSTSAYQAILTVANNGSAPASNVQATYTIDGGTAQTLNCGTIAVGTPYTTTVNANVTGISDAWVLTADPSNAIEELSDANNTANSTYTIYPNLTIAATTAAVNTPADAAYVLTIVVTNAGPAACPTTSTLSYTINPGVGGTDTINALASGASQTFTYNKTATGLSTTIVATADSGTVIAEWNETDNVTIPAATYVFEAQNQGNTSVNGTILESFHFTVPSIINWNQDPSKALTAPLTEPQMARGLNTATRDMEVTSNKKWNVGVWDNSGSYVDANGVVHMTKFDGTTYDTAVYLNQGLNIVVTSEPDATSPIAFVKNASQIIADGVAADLTNETAVAQAYKGGTILEYTRHMPVTFNQTVKFVDPALDVNHYYHMLVTFKCTVTDY